MRITKALGTIAAVAFLAACEVTTVGPGPSGPVGPAAAPQSRTGTLSASQAARSFVNVVNTLEPVAERECRARTTGVNCNFNIVVDDRPGQPANAFQTLDKQGRPIVAFTLALIADARWAPVVAAAGTGALLYTSMNSLAWALARRERRTYAVPMLAGLVVGLVSITYLLLR